jgi:IS5 family transposase
MAWLSVVYRLALRSTIDLVASLMKLLNAELPVPHSTTLCRRRRRLEISLPQCAKGEPLHLVVDVAGIKVYGEGSERSDATIGLNGARGASYT